LRKDDEVVNVVVEENGPVEEEKEENALLPATRNAI